MHFWSFDRFWTMRWALNEKKQSSSVVGSGCFKDLSLENLPQLLNFYILITLTRVEGKKKVEVEL